MYEVKLKLKDDSTKHAVIVSFFCFEIKEQCQGKGKLKRKKGKKGL